jgi:hypothetical protein
MNMQELTNSIKRPNWRITGIKKEEEVQAKGIHNIFNKIITKFPKPRENCPFKYRNLPVQQIDLTKIE